MKALEDQVRIEFEASLQYILMAAHFDQVTKVINDKHHTIIEKIEICPPTQLI